MRIRGGVGTGSAVVVIAGSLLVAAPLLLRGALDNSRSELRTALTAPVGAVARSTSDTEPVRVESALPTRVSMRNVDFRVGDGVDLRIRSLEGALRGVRRGVVDFDDRTSYRLVVDTAEVGLTATDITNLLNKHVFAYPGAPLRHLKVEIRDGQLRQSGTLRKGVDIPFSMTATVSLTADRRIRLHPTRIRIFGVNGTKLMSALGLDLQKMLNLAGATGVAVEKNDLLLSPLVILPPPVIEGRIVQLRVAGGELIQIFGGRIGTPPATGTLALPDSSARNYMLYRGGTLHFGKMYMTDAEMLIVDRDPTDPFDFDNIGYQRQLVSGYSRTLPDLGLEVFMPDAGKVTTVAAPIP
jgi:hypothetical protein